MREESDANIRATQTSDQVCQLVGRNLRGQDHHALDTFSRDDLIDLPGCPKYGSSE